MRKEEDNLKRKERSKPYPNHLKACIRRAGYKIQEIADEINMPRATLSDYIAGNRPVPRKSLEKIAHLLRCDIEELLEMPQGRRLPEEHTVKSDSQETDQRDHHKNEKIFLLEIKDNSHFLPTYRELKQPLWEQLRESFTTVSFLDENALCSLEQVTQYYWQLRTKTAYRDLLSGFLGHLETIVQLLKYSHPSITQKRLCSLASETAQRIGSIYLDINDYLTAFEYYKVAMDAAQEANHQTLFALALGRMGALSIYNSQTQEIFSFRDALASLEQAQNTAIHCASPIILAWLACVKAEIYAHMSNLDACSCALGSAEQWLQQIRSEEETYGVSFDTARLAGYKGACLLHFQKPLVVVASLKEASQFLDTSATRQQSIILADMASAYVQQREIEEACKMIRVVLRTTFPTKSGLVLQRIYRVRRELQPWETVRAVKDLDKQMAAYGILE